jgi:hypothetical protein
MRRVARNIPDRTGLHNLALVEDDHSVAQVAHHFEIVRDEQIAESALDLEVLKEIQDLRLDREVERAHGLIADHQLG